jgi:hypothetical protein
MYSTIARITKNIWKLVHPHNQTFIWQTPVYFLDSSKEFRKFRKKYKTNSWDSPMDQMSGIILCMICNERGKNSVQ